MTPPRRSPLAVALVVLALGAGCTSTPPSAPAPAPATPPTATNAAPPAGKGTVSLAWGSGWTLRVRPVFSGTALAVGDGTVTVETWNGGPSVVRYEFPAFTSNAAQPEIVAASEGLLRREPASGRITVPPHATHASAFTPTVFWPGGDAAAPGPLLWLPPEVTASLKAKGTAPLSIVALPNGLRMRTTPASGGDTVTLTVASKGEVMLPVDGAKTRFPAYRLTDDQGSTYTLLDAPQNPLVVRFRFGGAPVVAGRKLVMAASCGYDVVSLSSPAK